MWKRVLRINWSERKQINGPERIGIKKEAGNAE